MKYVLLTVACLGIIGASSFLYWKSTPEYAVLQIKSSLENRNQAQFEEYVDLKRITGSIVDDVLQESLAKTTMSKNKWAAFGSLLASKMIESMKPQFELIIEREMAKLFTSEREVASFSPNSVIKGLTNVRTQLRFNDYQKNDCSAQVCYFTGTFNHDISGKKIHISAKFEKSSVGWKLVELPGLVESVKHGFNI